MADAGGAPGGKSTYDRLKFEAILQGEQAMGVAAHNIGAAEAALGPDYLRDVARRLHVPLVSTNVPLSDGQPLAEPLRIIPAAGRSVAILGVLSPKFAAAGLRIASPREAILQALQQAAGRYQAAIVLAYLPEEELQPLAEGLPEVDVVVGGPTGQPVAPRHLGPTLVLSATSKASSWPDSMPRRTRSSVGRAGSSSSTITSRTIRLQVANVAQFRKELGRRDIAAADTSFGPKLAAERAPRSFAVAGTKTCRDCHKPEAQAWDKSRHAQAWKSLAGARGPGRSRLPALSHHGLRPARWVRLDGPQSDASSRWAARTVMAPAGSMSASPRSTRAISPRRRINVSPATITRTARGSTSLPTGPRSGTARIHKNEEKRQ